MHCRIENQHSKGGNTTRVEAKQILTIWPTELAQIPPCSEKCLYRPTPLPLEPLRGPGVVHNNGDKKLSNDFSETLSGLSDFLRASFDIFRPILQRLKWQVTRWQASRFWWKVPNLPSRFSTLHQRSSYSMLHWSRSGACGCKAFFNWGCKPAKEWKLIGNQQLRVNEM